VSNGALHALYIAVEWKRARVSCFTHNSNKYTRVLYVKKNMNVCMRCTHKACKARIETRDGTDVEECAFHCHAEKILHASAIVTRIACKRKASEYVIRQRIRGYFYNQMRYINYVLLTYLLTYLLMERSLR